MEPCSSADRVCVGWRSHWFPGPCQGCTREIPVPSSSPLAPRDEALQAPSLPRHEAAATTGVAAASWTSECMYTSVQNRRSNQRTFLSSDVDVNNPNLPHFCLSCVTDMLFVTALLHSPSCQPFFLSLCSSNYTISSLIIIRLIDHNWWCTKLSKKNEPLFFLEKEHFFFWLLPREGWLKNVLAIQFLFSNEWFNFFFVFYWNKRFIKSTRNFHSLIHSQTSNGMSSISIRFDRNFKIRDKGGSLGALRLQREIDWSSKRGEFMIDWCVNALGCGWAYNFFCTLLSHNYFQRPW